MASYGYARVSTTDQDLTTQVEKLRAAGCDVVREEKLSGTSRTGRSELENLITFLRKGDVLIVTRIDRLARSVGDLQDIVRELRGKGAQLRATDQPIDTSTAAGKAFLDMLGVFAEFETNLRKERQLEGIKRVKDVDHERKRKGLPPLVYKGRPTTIDPEAIRKMHSEGVGPSDIAKRLKIGRASVYRALKD